MNYDAITSFVGRYIKYLTTNAATVAIGIFSIVGLYGLPFILLFVFGALGFVLSWLSLLPMWFLTFVGLLNFFEDKKDDAIGGTD